MQTLENVHGRPWTSMNAILPTPTHPKKKHMHPRGNTPMHGIRVERALAPLAILLHARDVTHTSRPFGIPHLPAFSILTPIPRLELCLELLIFRIMNLQYLGSHFLPMFINSSRRDGCMNCVIHISLYKDYI